MLLWIIIVILPKRKTEICVKEHELLFTVNRLLFRLKSVKTFGVVVEYDVLTRINIPISWQYNVKIDDAQCQWPG